MPKHGLSSGLHRLREFLAETAQCMCVGGKLYRALLALSNDIKRTVSDDE
jgi:hypothetical protein